MNTDQAVLIGELTKALEPVIRRIFREELQKIAERYDTFHLNSDTPIFTENTNEIKESEQEENESEYEIEKPDVMPDFFSDKEMAEREDYYANN